MQRVIYIFWDSDSNVFTDENYERVLIHSLITPNDLCLFRAGKEEVFPYRENRDILVEILTNY